MSYFGEKVFEQDNSMPITVVETESHKFARKVSHVFVGTEKPINPVHFSDKKELYKEIIKGKQRVSELTRIMK